MSDLPIKSVHWLKGTDATEKANNMLGLGWDILETGMNPYGEPTFLMGWSVWMENPPAAAALTQGTTDRPLPHDQIIRDFNVDRVKNSLEL